VLRVLRVGAEVRGVAATAVVAVLCCVCCVCVEPGMGDVGDLALDVSLHMGQTTGPDSTLCRPPPQDLTTMLRNTIASRPWERQHEQRACALLQHFDMLLRQLLRFLHRMLRLEDCRHRQTCLREYCNGPQVQDLLAALITGEQAGGRLSVGGGGGRSSCPALACVAGADTCGCYMPGYSIQ
jgi:hypothetical protein